MTFHCHKCGSSMGNVVSGKCCGESMKVEPLTVAAPATFQIISGTV